MAILSSRVQARSGVATKNSRARTSGEAARKIKTKLLRLQSPRGFSALTGLYYLVRPTKTAMLRRLNSVVSIAEKRTARLKSWFRLLGVQVAVEGKGWMVLSIDNYDYGIF